MCRVTIEDLDGHLRSIGHSRLEPNSTYLTIPIYYHLLQLIAEGNRNVLII